MVTLADVTMLKVGLMIWLKTTKSVKTIEVEEAVLSQKEDLEEWIDNSLLLPTNQRTQMLLMVLLKEVMDTKTEVRLMPLLMLTLTSMVIISSSRVTIMLGAQLNLMLAIVATLVEIKETNPKVKTQVEQPPEVVQIISNLLRILEELINTSNLQVRMHSIMELLVLNKLKNLL